MKTLQEIKDEVAKEHNYEGWDDLTIGYDTFLDGSEILDKVTDEVAKRYAQEALKEAAEQAELKRENYFNLTDEEKVNCSEVWEEGCDVPSEGIVVDKESITNIELK